MREGGEPEPRGGDDFDRYFDGDLSSRRRRELLEGLAGDKCEEVVRTNHALCRLRQPIDSIDVTHAVLERVHARRAFLPRRLRSMVRAGRLGMAAVLVLSVLSVALLQRYNPGALRLTAQAAPLSDVLERSELDTTAGLDSLSFELDSIRRSLRVVADTDFTGPLHGSAGVDETDRLGEPARTLVVFASSSRIAPSGEIGRSGPAGPPAAASDLLGDLSFTVGAGHQRPVPGVTAGFTAPRGVGPARSPTKWRVTPIVSVSSRDQRVVCPAPVSLNLRGPVRELLSGSGDVSVFPDRSISSLDR